MSRGKKKFPSQKTTERAKSSAEPRLPKALFSTGFDEIATQWHKNLGSPASLLPSIQLAMGLEGLRVAEALIVAPKVSFKVYGENVVLCRLIDTFGIKGVEQLLEEGAIEFVLWRGDVMMFVENPPPGLLPLAPSTATDAAHSDPQVSTELGLKGWGKHAWPEVERLAKLAMDRTILSTQTLPEQAVQSVYAAYKAGALTSDGFEKNVPLENIGTQARQRMCKLASRVLEGMVLLENDYDLHEASSSWEALLKVCSKIRSEDQVVETVQHVLKLEGLPSIPALVLKDVLKFEDIVSVRTHPATTEFRKWLWSQPDPHDTKAVGEAYAAAITGKKLVDREWFKVAKIFGMNAAQTGVGAGIGASVAGVPGMIVGGVAGLAMSIGETFALDKLLRGLSPRRFAEEVVRPRTAAKLTTDLAEHGNRQQRRAEAAKLRKSGP